MNNKSVSDFVAATMDAVLNSAEHKSLFGVNNYKFAQDLNSAKDKCSKCSKSKDSCMCDSAMSDDVKGTGVGADPYVFPVDKITGKPASSDTSKADDNDARKKKDSSSDSSSDSQSADDNDARKKKDSSDSSSDSSDADDDEDMKSSAAFNVAIDSLLTASAALDVVGMEKSAALSLQLASLVVEAKKKDKESKKSGKSSSDSNDAKAKAKEKAAKEKEKAAKEKAKEKEKRDTQMAKDKAAKEKAKAKEKAEKEKASKSSSKK